MEDAPTRSWSTTLLWIAAAIVLSFIFIVIPIRLLDTLFGIELLPEGPWFGAEAAALRECEDEIENRESRAEVSTVTTTNLADGFEFDIVVHVTTQEDLDAADAPPVEGAPDSFGPSRKRSVRCVVREGAELEIDMGALEPRLTPATM